MSTIPLDRAKDLAMLFHLNSEPWMNTQAYDEPSPPLPIFSIETAPRVPLPPAKDCPIVELIRSRYSCREFSGAALAAADLATLLQHSYGFVGLREVAEVRLHHRPVPSAGALFPLEIYLLAENVTGIPNGGYHYAAWHHRLERVADNASIAALLPSLQEQQYLVGANALVFITAVFSRTMTKYGPRGYRYILLEAGHVAQNMCLLATELGLATLCLGGFRESAINEVFKLDGPKEGAVYAVAIGHGTQSIALQAGL